MPTRQRLRTELQAELRAVSVADYLIFYRIESDAVMIVRILHGSRNITARLFSQRS
jgi:plasmid stabilization system protein ParE